MFVTGIKIPDYSIPKPMECGWAVLQSAAVIVSKLGRIKSLE